MASCTAGAIRLCNSIIRFSLAWSLRSINLSKLLRLGLGLRLRAGFGHDLFDFVGGAREFCGEQLVAVLRDQDVVFDAHAVILFGDVNAGLVGDYHARGKGAAIVHVVDVEAEMMSYAVKEVAAER